MYNIIGRYTKFVNDAIVRVYILYIFINNVYIYIIDIDAL